MTVYVKTLFPAFLLGLICSVNAAPQLNGMAVHNELSEDQFIAAVYSETLTKDAKTLLLKNEDKVMELHVLAPTLYARRFKRLWIEGIAINAGDTDLKNHAQNLADFSNWLRIKLKAGDILKIERLTGKGTKLSINNSVLGTIADDHFFDLLLRTWIGPVPLSTDFKLNLLAGGEVSDELRQL